jgi:outer membrane protein TolC
VEDAWLQFAPSIAVTSQLAWNSQALFGPMTTWNLQGVLTVPIWDGGARYGALRDARAATDQARQALTQARLGALVEVTQATRAVTVKVASRDLAQTQRDLALRIDQRTREGYLHGLGTSLDLVTSAQALRQAEINLVILQFQASEARVLATLSNADCLF